MADNKTYAGWIDVPDGAGGTERHYLKDVEARESLNGKAAATHTHTKSDITDYDNPEAAFVGETLVFYSGAAFSGEVLVLG